MEKWFGTVEVHGSSYSVRVEGKETRLPVVPTYIQVAWYNTVPSLTSRTILLETKRKAADSTEIYQRNGAIQLVEETICELSLGAYPLKPQYLTKGEICILFISNPSHSLR